MTQTNVLPIRPKARTRTPPKVVPKTRSQEALALLANARRLARENVDEIALSLQRTVVLAKEVSSKESEGLYPPGVVAECRRLIIEAENFMISFKTLPKA